MITYRSGGAVFYTVSYATVCSGGLWRIAAADSTAVRAAIVAFLAVLTFALYVLLRGRVELHPHALVLVDVGRTEVPWRDIVRVETTASAGARQVVITTRNRKRRRLRAPVHTPFAPDHEFDAKVATIKERWERERVAPPT